MLVIQVSVGYILKHSADKKAWSVHIYCHCFDLIVIFNTTRFMLYSSLQLENSNDVTPVLLMSTDHAFLSSILCTAKVEQPLRSFIILIAPSVF